jgi:hypothetical protein
MYPSKGNFPSIACVGLERLLLAITVAKDLLVLAVDCYCIYKYEGAGNCTH